MIASPAGAPPRPDLDWLRHRTRRSQPVAQPSGGGAGGGSTALADFLAGRTTRRRPQPVPTATLPAPTSPTPPVAAPAARRDDLDLSGDPLDLSAPAPTPPPPAPTPPAPTRSSDLDLSDDLDLSGPSPQPAPDLRLPVAPPAERPGPSSDLDLDLSAAGPPAPAAPPASSSDLDLFPEPAAPVPAPQTAGPDLDLFPDPVPAPAPTPAARPRAAPVVRTVPRVAPGARVILTPREPTVVLDRLQSGIGGLTVTAVCSPAVGDLVLGAVYQLADGTSGVLGAGTGITTAPPRSRRPVLQGGRDEFEHIAVDLRQSRSLRRFVVWATSASERELAWGGTLRLATHGGSRVEIPLDVGQHAGPLVVASVYALDGEFVVRAELDPVHGVARDVARAYGFGAITWADPRTPVL